MNLVHNADKKLKEKILEASPYITDSSPKNDVFFITFPDVCSFIEPILRTFNNMVCDEVKLLNN